MWCSSPSASTSHCTLSPTRDFSTGVLPTNAWPLIVSKPRWDSKNVTNSCFARGTPCGRIETAPYMPPAIESIIDGEWSW